MYRNNQYIDMKSISYDDVAKGTNSSTLTIPGEETPPPEEPVQAEVNESNEETTGEEQQTE
ncbi:hypothetical protein D3C72_2389080 [compost metagenome]